jgi:acyl-coenzyme A thioesterase 13
MALRLPLENKMNPSSLGAAASRIKGNLPPNVKQMLDTVMHEVMARPNVYGASIGERVAITEASMVPKTEEPTRTEARVVCEVTVTEGPSNRPPPRLFGVKKNDGRLQRC